MRVTFVSNLYPPNQVGGYEELCCEVATYFAIAGHTVSVLTSTHGGKTASQPRQLIHQALRLLVGDTIYQPFKGTRGRRETLVRQNNRALEDCIARDRPDVIFCWNLYGLDRALIDEFGKLEIPVVFMVTDNWLAGMTRPDFVGQYFKTVVHGDATDETFLAPTPATAVLPDNVSAVFGAEYMRRFYAAAGLVFKTSEVIHNGVLLDPAEPKPRAPLDSAGTVRLLFAGRVVDVKGVHVAVRALGELARRAPGIDWKLDIVGDLRDEPYHRRLVDIAQAQGVGDRLTFVGRVPADELPEVFASRDIFIFPSLYEPFSLTLIHALASGIPTVASNVGGNPEIVVEGQTGLLYPKEDAARLAERIIEMVEQPERTAQLGRSGRAAAQGFSNKRMIDSMIAHLQARVSEVRNG